MKKLMRNFAVMVLALVTVTAFAQSGPKDRKNHDPETMVKKMVERMTEKLGLNQEQQKKVYDLQLKEFNDRKNFRGERGEGNRPSEQEMEKMRGERQQKMEKFDAEMKKILDSDQYDKWHEMRKEEMRGPNGRHRHEPPREMKRDEKRPEQTPESRAKFMADRLAKDLALTDAQKEKVYNLHLDRKADCPAGERSKGEKPSQEQLDAMKKGMEKFDAEMKSILTTEQYAKWQELKQKKQVKKHDRKVKNSSPGGNTSK